MFANQPIYAVIMSLIYVVLTYFLVKKENNYITYGATFLSAFMQVTFLYLWYKNITFLLANINVELAVYLKFARFIDLSYLVLFIPMLFLLAWYGVKGIINQNQYLLLKIIIAVIYLTVLLGLLFFGNVIFGLLYYGFAP